MVGLCSCGCGAAAPLAKTSNKSRGWVRGKPLKWVQGHSLRAVLHRNTARRPSKSLTPIERIEARSKRTRKGCLLWQGCVNRNGYGYMSVRSKSVSLHRFVYEYHYGQIPKGFNVCHRCDNPNCVEKTHLWIGTQSQNIADAYAKGRRKKKRRYASR